MHKVIQFIKGNKYTLLSAFLPLFLVFSVGFGFLWFVEKEQITWLEERGFENFEEYSKYRDNQQAEIYELTTAIKEMQKDIAQFSGDADE